MGILFDSQEKNVEGGQRRSIKQRMCRLSQQNVQISERGNLFFPFTCKSATGMLPSTWFCSIKVRTVGATLTILQETTKKKKREKKNPALNLNNLFLALKQSIFFMWQLPIFFPISYIKYEGQRLDDVFPTVKAKDRVKLFQRHWCDSGLFSSFQKQYWKILKNKFSQFIDLSHLSQKYLAYLSQHLHS